MNPTLHAFLDKHEMLPERIEPLKAAEKMVESMRAGLEDSPGGLPMIPTYLRFDGHLPAGSSAIVIDAGGTNFRCGLVTFSGDSYRVEYVKKQKMPGIEHSVSWKEFISFVADMILPLTDKADAIGFCFSYSAVITPEIDGRVIRIDKEVMVTGSEGQMVGASLLAELESRGVTGKHIVILNDTAAVLLGGTATLDKTAYGGFIGQVSGTGTNTCCILPENQIGKLHSQRDCGIIINLESGLYDGLPVGDFDRQLDEESHNPGLKRLEKQTAGVYLGPLAHLILAEAGRQGLLTDETQNRLNAFGSFDSAVLDAWACGERLEVASCEEDARFIEELSQALFERSARCMCTNLLAIMLLTGEGTEPGRPVCVCAEGSLVQKGRVYRPLLESFLTRGAQALGRSVVLRVGEETTLPGSAAAAILNK